MSGFRLMIFSVPEVDVHQKGHLEDQESSQLKKTENEARLRFVQILFQCHGFEDVRTRRVEIAFQEECFKERRFL
jgi:hypothetical protein